MTGISTQDSTSGAAVVFQIAVSGSAGTYLSGLSPASLPLPQDLPTMKEDESETGQLCFFSRAPRNLPIVINKVRGVCRAEWF